MAIFPTGREKIDRKNQAMVDVAGPFQRKKVQEKIPARIEKVPRITCWLRMTRWLPHWTTVVRPQRKDLGPARPPD